MIGIYKITNTVNQKCYIGQSVNIERRFSDHKNRVYYTQYETPLYKAFKKYGVDKFLFEVLEECSKELLDERERYYIALFKSADKKYGYNFTFGGKGYTGTHYEDQRKLWNKHISEGKTGKKIKSPSAETLAKRSQSLRGIPRTEVWLRRMSESLKGREISPETRAKISASLKGRHPSEEAIEKLRIASTGRVQTEEARKKISQRVSKKVCQLDNEGHVISIYSSAREANSATGISFSNISSCCNGKRKKAGGFGWKFFEDKDE